MPTYEYACTSCGHQIEVFQRFTEDPLTTCGVCGGPLRKVFHPAGIVFKGSGFYATDSRKSGATSGTKKETDGASKTEGSSDKAASTTKDAASTSSGGSDTGSASGSGSGSGTASSPSGSKDAS
jgi:putative FmdB family regulatory protein